MPADVIPIAANRARERPQRTGTVGRPTLSNEQLLDVALDLFLANGFDRTSLEAITAAAGMAKRTVYARYADKEALFRAALRRAIADWIVPPERLRALETPDLDQTLLRIGETLVANIMSPAGLRLLRLTNTVAGRMPEIAAQNVQQGTEPTEAYLADLFARRVDFAGSAVGAAEAATAFLHLVVGGPSSMAAWGVELDAAAIDRLTRSSVELFLHGLMPRPAGADAVEDENRRLRMMLTDALLENAALTERLAGLPTDPD